MNKGTLSKAIQCDLCYTWVYAACEEVKKAVQNTCSTNISIVNCVYYCTLNRCTSHCKQMLFDQLQSQSASDNNSIIQQVETLCNTKKQSN